MYVYNICIIILLSEMAPIGTENWVFSFHVKKYKKFHSRRYIWKDLFFLRRRWIKELIINWDQNIPG